MNDHEDDPVVVSPERVAISSGPTRYDASAPYSPGTRFPEYPFDDEPGACGANGVYAAVRESLRLLGLDEARFGTREWNPLRGIVRPGDTVVLKPNLVRDRRETLPGLEDCILTHGSVLRAVLDYVWLALGGRGRIVVADAPMDDADFERVRQATGIDAIGGFYHRRAGLPVEVCDLRLHHDRKIDGIIVGRDRLAGDPAGYVTVDLGERSAFHEIEPLCSRLYGASYEVEKTRQYHAGGAHRYVVSRTVLAADCVVELPKLKTHKKTGLTANMKLLVGICGDKDSVAHYRVGVPAAGGDQFAGGGVRERLEYGVLGAFKRTFHWLGPLRRLLAAPLRRMGEVAFGRTDEVVRSGNWYGNDTAWRMCHDLMRILLYADAEGRVRDRPVRRVFSVVDAIVAGEGNGPLDATPKPAGVILAGVHPVVVDLVAARLMGFDYRRLAVLARAGDRHPLPLVPSDYAAIVTRSDRSAWDRPLARWEGPALAFCPHFGWRGHIEIDAPCRGSTG